MLFVSDVLPATGFLTRATSTENEIVGEALVALLHDDLKSMGITSVGHRLTVLKSVYDVKKAQDVPIENDHYVPLCMLCPIAAPGRLRPISSLQRSC